LNFLFYQYQDGGELSIHGKTLKNSLFFGYRFLFDFSSFKPLYILTEFRLGRTFAGRNGFTSYAEKANRDSGSTFISPKAVFALDLPLELVHLFNQAKRDIERHLHRTWDRMANEE
ncbi:MAG: hypothetical protein WCE57_08985, partial [Salegentibacter sp.]